MKNSPIIIALLFTLYTAQAHTTFRTILGDTTQVSNKSELYEVHQDADYIYFTVNTGDPKIMMSMLRQGVTVYYDIKGKKKRKVSVTYPVRGDAPKRQRQERSLGQQNEERSEPTADRLYEMVRNHVKRGLPQQATYAYYGDDTTFNVQLNSQDIAVQFIYDSENQLLNYQIKMPKTKISNDPEVDFSKLTIGVVTPERTTENREGGSGQNARAGGGNNQRGGSPGGGGGGGRGGQRGGGQKKPSRQGTSGVTLNFWFKAGL
jgi:uncharacterized membrane protein YgcG